jgi:hypothetical protein
LDKYSCPVRPAGQLVLLQLHSIVAPMPGFTPAFRVSQHALHRQTSARKCMCIIPPIVPPAPTTHLLFTRLPRISPDPCAYADNFLPTSVIKQLTVRLCGHKRARVFVYETHTCCTHAISGSCVADTFAHMSLLEGNGL